MNKKKKILWILLVILITLIILTILIVLLFNKNNNSNNNSSNNNTINTLKNTNWKYFNSYFYDNKNTSSAAIFDYFELSFTDKEVKICFEDNCSTSSYTLKNNILIIENLERFSGEFKISQKDDYMTLEESYNNGSRLVYYFITALG